jgi:hypothetical protein
MKPCFQVKAGFFYSLRNLIKLAASQHRGGMHMLNKILGTLTVPIMFLNFGGGIVGGIWLAFLGEWKLIGIGILLLFTSHWILSILMMPGMPIVALAAHLLQKKNPIGYFVGYLSQLYTNVLIVGTCVLAFFICARFYNGPIDFGFTPYLLWSWGMALGPWQYFASKEPENEFSAITLFSASVFYLFFLTSIFVSPILGLIVIALFAVAHLLVLPIFNMYLARKIDNYY